MDGRGKRDPYLASAFTHPSRWVGMKRCKDHVTLDGGGAPSPGEQREQTGKGSIWRRLEVLGGGGGGGGEEDVPDIRFLLGTPLAGDFTFDVREAVFIDYLKSKNVVKEELETTIRVSEALNNQRPAAIVPLNARAAVLTGALRRKRRHLTFLLIMIDAFGRGKFWDVDVPRRYRDLGQLRGDAKALLKGIRTLHDDLLGVLQQVKDLHGEPIKIPEIFKVEVKLPNARK